MANDVVVKQGKLGIGDTTHLSALTVKPKPAFQLAGTVAKTEESPTLTGTGTAFDSQVGLGDQVQVPGGDADEFRTVVAIASSTVLTVDQPFAVTATAQVAHCHPSIARFANSDGETALLVGGDGALSLRGHSAGAMQLLVTDQDDLIELDFSPVQSTETGIGSLFSIGRKNGIQIQTGVRVSGALSVAANTTLDQGQYVVYVDAGSGGVTITLPELGTNGQEGRSYYVFKTAGSGNVSVTAHGSESINGANASKTITAQWSGLLLFAVESSQTWIATTLAPA